MADEKTSREFQDWLNTRIKESDVTANEAAELTRWLMSRSCDEPEHQSRSISSSDVIQLISWIKTRLNDVVVAESQKSEFSHWLTEQLANHSCLSERDLQHIKNEMLEI